MLLQAMTAKKNFGWWQRALTGALLAGTLCSCGGRGSATPATSQAGASHAPGSKPAGSPGARPIDAALPRPDPIALSAPLPGFTRGVNLGNGLDAPSEGAWGTKLTDQHFTLAKQAGFDHVRLPVRFTTAERSDPNSPFNYQQYGVQLHEAKKLEEAAAAFNCSC